MNNLGIYVHWPFCIKKCPYCDFNSYQNQNHVPNDWLKFYQEYKECKKNLNQPN